MYILPTNALLHGAPMRDFSDDFFLTSTESPNTNHSRHSRTLLLLSVSQALKLSAVN